MLERQERKCNQLQWPLLIWVVRMIAACCALRSATQAFKCVGNRAPYLCASGCSLEFVVCSVRVTACSTQRQHRAHCESNQAKPRELGPGRTWDFVPWLPKHAQSPIGFMHLGCHGEVPLEFLSEPPFRSRAPCPKQRKHQNQKGKRRYFTMKCRCF
jgi:hypothetical protein